MNVITTQNNQDVVIENAMRIGIYLYPGIEKENLRVLDLASKSDLVVMVSGDESLENTDAAICANRDISLGIRTRDCAPICFSDGKKIGIAHVGWRGLSMGLVEKILGYFDVATVVVYVGPFLHSFEIKKDFCYDALVKKEGLAECIVEENGMLTFEFQKALAAILPEQAIFDSRSTGTDIQLPSNRRDRESKGFLTTISFA